MPPSDAPVPPRSAPRALGRSAHLGLLRDDPITLFPAFVLAFAALAMVVFGGYVPQHADVQSAGRLFQIAAGLAAAIVAWLCVVRPWPGLVAWVVAMPLVNVARSQLTPLGIQLIPTTVFVIALAFGWALQRRRPSPADRAAARSRLEPVAAAASLAIVGLAVVATLAAARPAASLPIALHGLVEPAVVGLLAVLLRPRRSQLAVLLAAMAASVALASVFNLVRIATLVHSLSQLELERVLFARLTYYNVGLFGVMLTISIPLAVGAILARARLAEIAARAGLRRVTPVVTGWLAAGALVISVAALILTYSKSAWLSCGAALVLLALLAAPTWRLRGGLILGVAVVSAAVVPWPSWVLQPIAPGAASAYLRLVTDIEGSNRLASWDPNSAVGEVSIVERALATEAAFEMARDHPLLGVGPGGFEAAYATTYRPKTSTRELAAAHDMLPNIAAEFGIPAALLVTFAFGAAIVGAWRAWRATGGPERHLAAAALAAIVGFLLVSATFGIDLYRTYRLMDSDVLFAALLVAAGIGLWRTAAGPPEIAPPADDDAVAG